MKKRFSMISLMLALFCLFSSAGVVLADPVTVNYTPVIVQITIVLGIMVFIAALVGLLALRYLRQRRAKV